RFINVLKRSKYLHFHCLWTDKRVSSEAVAAFDNMRPQTQNYFLYLTMLYIRRRLSIAMYVKSILRPPQDLEERGEYLCAKPPLLGGKSR
ncbi:hypothetical protein AVEN_205377-1, partial [Araneus ventricosus]